MPESSIISSRQLDAFATVPHCLDNHFIPRDVLRRIREGAINARKVMRARGIVVRREYIRSLLYSPEVVINRAFALNEPAVFGDVKRYPASIASLIDNHRLTILLMESEQGLGDFIANPKFQINEKGSKAWGKYLNRYGESNQRYLKLSADEDEAVSSRFPDFVRKLIRLELTDRRLVEMFKSAAIGGYSREEFDRFKRFLQEQGRPWLESGPRITRTSFYQKFVMPEATDISKPDIDPRKEFSFELKLLADLAYDHNTPTELRRQSFIPMQMPSPLCLPPGLFDRNAASTYLDAGTASRVCDQALNDRQWYYESQDSFLVPDWANLTAEDVCAIQSWSDWTNFRIAQRAVANAASPDKFEERLQEYFKSLEDFQRHLAEAINTPEGALGHLRTGARILKLAVRPVVTWAGTMILPGVADQILTEFAQEGIEYTLDIAIDFLGRVHDQRHAEAVESFVARTSGMRHNIASNIGESASQRRALERISRFSEGSTTEGSSPAQRA